jgi:hypothetical protein
MVEVQPSACIDDERRTDDAYGSKEERPGRNLLRRILAAEPLGIRNVEAEQHGIGNHQQVANHSLARVQARVSNQQ